MWSLKGRDWNVFKEIVSKLRGITQAYKEKYPTKNIGLYNSVCESAGILYSREFTELEKIDNECWSMSYAKYVNEFCDFVTPSLYMKSDRTLGGWKRHTDWF